MKYYIIVSVIMILLLLGCSKKEGVVNIFSKKSEESEPEEKPVETITQYVKSWAVWFYKNEGDLGKPSKEVNEKKYMEFGSKVTVLERKDINGKTYSKVQLPDKTEYWIKADELIDKFIIINQNDVLCYKQPDNDYADTILLQPGDFGLFIQEMDGWLNVNFLAYRPLEPGGEKERVGNKWIKEGYTEDLNAAKESYYLQLAYYYLYSKEKNIDKAIERLEKALKVNITGETEITYVIKDLLADLKGGNKEAQRDNKGIEIITLNPDEKKTGTD